MRNLAQLCTRSTPIATNLASLAWIWATVGLDVDRLRASTSLCLGGSPRLVRAPSPLWIARPTTRASSTTKPAKLQSPGKNAAQAPRAEDPKDLTTPRLRASGAASLYQQLRRRGQAATLEERNGVRPEVQPRGDDNAVPEYAPAMRAEEKCKNTKDMEQNKQHQDCEETNTGIAWGRQQLKATYMWTKCSARDGGRGTRLEHRKGCALPSGCHTKGRPTGPCGGSNECSCGRPHGSSQTWSPGMALHRKSARAPGTACVFHARTRRRSFGKCAGGGKYEANLEDVSLSHSAGCISGTSGTLRLP